MHYLLLIYYYVFYLLLFFIFTAAPVAYGDSQLGVESELQLPAHATTPATPDLSCTCDLHPSLWQHWIRHSLNRARDRPCILMETEPQWELRMSLFYFYLFFVLFCPFVLSKAEPAAYGDSQARGPMELWPPAYARATATQGPSRICNLHHSSF